jgi:orotidine-5'-phosphate decarboxylase
LLKSKIDNRIILALDVQNIDQAVEIVSATSEYIDAVKVGLPLGLTAGLGVIRRIKEHTDLPIIADIKISDVPDIAAELAKICFSLGYEGITIQGFVGPTAIEKCVSESKKTHDVIVVTEITHMDGEIFMQPISEDIAQMAKDVGASGIQAPGTRPERVRTLRKIVGDDLLIVSCGIGTQGGEIGSAIKAGADFEIIGRTICNHHDPEQIAREISQKTKVKNRQLC